MVIVALVEYSGCLYACILCDPEDLGYEGMMAIAASFYEMTSYLRERSYGFISWKNDLLFYFKGGVYCNRKCYMEIWEVLKSI